MTSLSDALDEATTPRHPLTGNRVARKAWIGVATGFTVIAAAGAVGVTLWQKAKNRTGVETASIREV